MAKKKAKNEEAAAVEKKNTYGSRLAGTYQLSGNTVCRPASQPASTQNQYDDIHFHTWKPDRIAAIEKAKHTTVAAATVALPTNQTETSVSPTAAK